MPQTIQPIPAATRHDSRQDDDTLSHSAPCVAHGVSRRTALQHAAAATAGALVVSGICAGSPVLTQAVAATATVARARVRWHKPAPA